MANWYFPSNDHGEVKGINDSGVATFRGTPLQSLAREICQNSLDAASNYPVRVDFDTFLLPLSKLPGENELKDTFEKCSMFWKDQKAKTTKDFFANAIDKMSSDKVTILRISDFNTKGLCGSNNIYDINTDWYRLTKSSGSSDKKGPAGGSFGIGKFAPFACSDFSTVFYSTYDMEDKFAYQGVSRLVTFKRDDAETTQGIGYFGNEKNTPVFSQFNLDSTFTRNPGDYGTDIFILGYKYCGDDWEDKIVTAILDGFLGAIWNERLVLKVGQIEINKQTLGGLMDDYKEELVANRSYASEYYQVLTSKETSWFENENHLGLGKIKFGALIGNSEFHRKAAMIRQTGMKIKDADRLSGYIPFAAVMFIEGDKINEKLRLIENPEHTEWQPERSAKPIEAKAIVKSLNDFMIECIESCVADGNVSEIDVAGAGNYLPDLPEDANETHREEAITDKTIGTIEKKIVNKKAIPRNDSQKTNIDSEQPLSGSPSDDPESLDWPHTNNPKPTPPSPKPPSPIAPNPEGKQKTNKTFEVVPSKFLPICLDTKKGKYVLMFVPAINGVNGKIELYLSGENGIYHAPVVNASLIGGGEVLVNENKLSGLEFKKDTPLRISVDLDYSDYCSMEVKAYADKT